MNAEGLSGISGIDWRGIALLFGGLRAAASRRQPAKREDKRPDNSRSLFSLCSSFELMKEMKKKRANEASGAKKNGINSTNQRERQSSN